MPAKTARGDDPLAPRSDPIIVFDHVSKIFTTRRQGRVVAVDDVSLSISRGEVFGIVGYSGAGKSTVVRLINALERADSGTIEVDGRNVTALGERDLNALRGDIGMIFQQFNLFSARTVLANVAYPLLVTHTSKAKRLARARELLDFVGIADKADAYPSQLSGGQKQRVGIARALAASPSILLADEPTSALDPDTTLDVLDLVRRANRELGVTVVFITHAMNVVRHICDRIAVMGDGRIAEVGPTSAVLTDPQSALGQRFVETATRLDSPYVGEWAPRTAEGGPR